MSDRLTTLAGALFALLVITFLLYQPQPAETGGRPVSSDRQAYGYAGFVNWLEVSGVPWFSSLRRLGDTLSDPTIPQRGNVLVVTLPTRHPLRDGELAEVDAWVSRGNTLLVMSALNESPRWLSNAASFMDDDLLGLTGMAFIQTEDADGEPVLIQPDLSDLADERFSGLPIQIQPQAGHPLFTGIDTLWGSTETATNIWRPLLDEEASHAVSLGAVRGHDSAAFWQIAADDGVIIISAFASLLSNRGLAAADNARWSANLLSNHLSPDGVVIFDDFHQGVSDLYDAEAFFSDNRLHASIAFILAFWLIYLCGTSARFSRAAEDSAAPQQGDLVEALSGFMSRKLPVSDSGKLLVENWLQELQQQGTVTLTRGADGEIDYAAAWPQLAAMPLLDPGLTGRVELTYRQACSGGKVDLRGLHNQVHALRRILATDAELQLVQENR